MERLDQLKASAEAFQQEMQKAFEGVADRFSCHVFIKNNDWMPLTEDQVAELREILHSASVEFEERECNYATNRAELKFDFADVRFSSEYKLDSKERIQQKIADLQKELAQLESETK